MHCGGSNVFDVKAGRLKKINFITIVGHIKMMRTHNLMDLNFFSCIFVIFSMYTATDVEKNQMKEDLPQNFWFTIVIYDSRLRCVYLIAYVCDCSFIYNIVCGLLYFRFIGFFLVFSPIYTCGSPLLFTVRLVYALLYTGISRNQFKRSRGIKSSLDDRPRIRFVSTLLPFSLQEQRNYKRSAFSAGVRVVWLCPSENNNVRRVLFVNQYHRPLPVEYIHRLHGLYS